MKRKYKLTNKKRFIIIVCVLVSVIISTTILITKRPEGKSEEIYNEIIIKYGDTLWDIAVEISDGSIDVRKMVSEIRKINNMETSDLHIGQLVKIPSF